jgi:hypothetical protein
MKQIFPPGVLRAMRLCSSYLALILSLTLSLTTGASAASLEIRFTGIVETVSSGLVGGPINPDDAVSGIILIDSSVSDTSALSTQGFFPTAVVAFDYTIGTYSGTSTDRSGPNNYVNVYDNLLSAPSIDSFDARAGVLGPSINGISPTMAQFGISTFDTSVLSSDRMPTSAEIEAFLPSYRVFGDTNFVIFGSQRVDWAVTSFVAVPEPETAVLTLLGLLGICVHRRLTSR